MPTRFVNAVITFADGLPGFEAARHFVLVASPSLNPFTLVQGVDEGAPSFVAIEPRLVASGYDRRVDDADLARLEATGADALVWLALVTARSDGAATVNLRAPLVVNPASMRGIQLIAGDSPYPIDHPLTPE